MDHALGAQYALFGQPAPECGLFELLLRCDAPANAVRCLVELAFALPGIIRLPESTADTRVGSSRQRCQYRLLPRRCGTGQQLAFDFAVAAGNGIGPLGPEYLLLLCTQLIDLVGDQQPGQWQCLSLHWRQAIQIQQLGCFTHHDQWFQVEH